MPISARRYALLILMAAAVAVTAPRLWAQAPAPAQQAFSPADQLPFDGAVTHGTLPNGLTYFIRANGRPEKRVSLQLAVRAGSIDETDDQQGLAHFLEHMAFNGSHHFKPGELISTFESTGARLGPHVNAYTSFNETVYMFQLATDQGEIVRKGLQALSDFAGGMTLAPAEIDKERGVVIEEWRGGLGAGSRLRDQQIPALFYKSKYAERLPIGKPEVLRTFTPDQLRAFYARWYRPDRMGLIVVGDIDVTQTESMIRDEFGPLPSPRMGPPERQYEVPLHAELVVKVATDPEATQSSVSIIRKRKKESQSAVGDYRRGLVQSLVSQMINERFDELSRKADAAFLGAGASTSGLSPEVNTFDLSAGVEEGKLAGGLTALELESNRVRQFGFGAAEFDRARRSLLAAYDRAYTERDKTESGSYAQEYLNYFLEGEPSPGISYEYRLAQALLPSITVAEAAEAARSLFSDASRVVIAVSPQKASLTVPSETGLRDTLMKADAVAVTPWTDAAASAALMAKVPEPGAVKDRRDIAELGVTVVRFANGAEAWLKPTDFKNDQVLFSFVASGGASLAPPGRYPEASLAPALVELSGTGGHSAVDLQKLLAGTIASASPFVSLSTHGISGSSTPAHLETALQLLNLAFTAPGDDPQAFALIRRQLEAAYANRANDPGALFGEKLDEVNTSGHYTARPLTIERIGTLDRAAMSAFYRERFSSAADFTFFIVGAFKTDDALPLVARYVGSLRSQPRTPSRFTDLGITFPPVNVRAEVVKGREPRAQTVLSFFADPPIEENEQTRLAAATDVLEIAARDILREELGETYNVSVGLDQDLPQRGGGHVSVSFAAAPENISRMLDRVLQEVKRLQDAGPSADLTNRAKETALREHETAVKQNGYWLGRLQSAKILDRDPLLVLQRRQRIQAVTPAGLQEMFRKYFPLDRCSVVTLVPESR